MQVMHSRRVTVAIAAALVAVLAACDADPRAAGNDVESPEPTERPHVTPPSPEPSPEFDEDDAVLAVAVREPATLDPMRIQDPGSVLVVRQLFEGLTRWDPTTGEVVPAAARSWRATRGGRRFVFKLRPGMTFHDGSPVTADSFRFAFDRIAKKSNAADVAYVLDVIEGFEEVNQLGQSDHLSGVRARGKLTLVFRLSKAFYDFPALLTHPSLVPVRSRSVRNVDAFLRAPVGNGPFRMARPWSPGKQILLRAFSRGPQRPDIDGIRFVPFPDAASSWVRFLDGEVDVAEVPAGRVGPAAQVFGDEGFRPFLAAYFLGVNVDDSVLRQRRVRRAISLAIDRAAIARDIFKGTMAPPRGIVPRGMPGFDNDACGARCDHDPAAARRLIADLKPKQLRVVLDYNTGAPHPRVARAVGADLEDVGFRVRLRRHRFARYVRLLRDGEQGLYRLGWIAEAPVADGFLTDLFASGSPDNHSGFASKRVDRLLARARGRRSDAERVRLYAAAEKAVLDALPAIPIGSFVIHWAAHRRVRGLELDATGGFDAVAVSLDE